MTDSFESILDESISAMQAGIPIDEILAEVPDYASELRPLLYTATLLTDPNPSSAPEEKKSELRQKYMAQVRELPPPSPPQRWKTLAKLIKSRLTPKAVLSDALTILITIILTLTMIAFVLVYLAADTIPGDFFYSAKRASETIQLSLTTEQEASKLLETFNQRRLAEIEQLIELNRAAVVEFKGTLQTKGESLWIVEGYTVSLPNDIEIKGQPQEGDRIKVVGLLRTNNTLVADSIRLIE